MKLADLKYRAIPVSLFVVGVVAMVLMLVFRNSDSEPPETDHRLVARSNVSKVLSRWTPRKADRPREQPAGDHIGSVACKECHAHEHHTWHASYHRTMTQAVSTADRLFGDFNNVTVTNHAIGRTYRLDKQDGKLLFLTENHSEIPLSRSEGFALPIVMTTGSHHMQAYWFATGEGQTLGMVPFVYLRKEKRWIPRNAAFLNAPVTFDSIEPGRWNNICINCHTTPDRFSKVSTNGFETTVTEFGIACESCHGPGKRHLEFQRALVDNPKGSGAVGADTDPIVNPKKLSPALSSQVCGSCHSISISLNTNSPAFRVGFRPGNELSNYVHVMRGTKESARHWSSVDPFQSREEISVGMHNRFWPDGQVRVTGREYNGLIETPCHQRGTLSCLSCHTLHPSRRDSRSLEEWADDQLKEGMRTDAACTQCHEAGKYADVEHTHHRPESTGSQCQNCHMPHTTYGLLKAIRSHTIDSPNALKSYETGRPNACNLCHLDRSLSWTAEHLTDWFGQPGHEMKGDWEDVSAAVMWSVTGDAAQRALVAWHYNWEPARAVSGTNWLAPYLAILADDDYDAVRYIAARALRRLPEYAGSDFDFVGPASARKQVIAAIMQRWSQTQNDRKNFRESVLIDARGKVRDGELQRLYLDRNTRPISLAE